jgi:hypothetical protein
MELVLYVHIRHWDRRKQYFRSEAFENSSDGSGISVVDVDCIRRGECRCVCNHARRFYPTVSSEPPIFWQFDESVLPDGYRLNQTPSDSADECHHNIAGIKDGKEKKFFKRLRNDGGLAFKICDGNSPRDLRAPEDIDILLGTEVP